MRIMAQLLSGRVAAWPCRCPFSWGSGLMATFSFGSGVGRREPPQGDKANEWKYLAGARGSIRAQRHPAVGPLLLAAHEGTSGVVSGNSAKPRLHRRARG